MTDTLHQLQSHLKAHHHSLTTPRRIVFSALQDQEPLTMRDLVIACGNAIDRASIYRTVSLFEALGIIQRLQVGWKYRLELGDAFQHHHHHMYCVHCGLTTPLPEDSMLENRLQLLATAQGFHPQDHQIEIRGLCIKCRPKQKAT